MPLVSFQAIEERLEVLLIAVGLLGIAFEVLACADELLLRPADRPTGMAITMAMIAAIMRRITPSRIQTMFLGIPYIVLLSFLAPPPSFSVIRVAKLRANDASGAIEDAMGEPYGTEASL